jgi:glycosyltransferase involved in cell wall biosynthesis
MREPYQSQSGHNSRDKASKPIILALVGWPRGDASGPVRSLVELAESVPDEFNFKIIAREGKAQFFKGTLGSKTWEPHGVIDRYWCQMGWWGPRGLVDLVRTTPHDILWLNGFFDRELTLPAILARNLRRVPRRPTILSIRGEFADGALALKSARKRTFLSVASLLGLHRDLWLHASDTKEANDISKVYPHARGVLIAPDMHRLFDPVRLNDPVYVKDGATVRIVFFSRIVRKKNLHYALDVLCHVKSKVAFDIIGPVEDPAYWRECEARIKRLPTNITVCTKGEISNAEVSAILPNYSLMLLPTLGENFGHVIFEALSCGVPVLISDKTPWRGLEADCAGWDLPLDNPVHFARVIDTVAATDEATRARFRASARARVERWATESDAIGRSKVMLRTLLSDTANTAKMR